MPKRQISKIHVDNITIDSRFNPQCLTVILRRSKTNQSGVRVTISLGCNHPILCPVSAVLAYLSVPPFISVSRWYPLVVGSLVSSVHEALYSQRVDTTAYSRHSFCIGVTSMAAEAGIRDAVIKQLGRWKSTAFTLYIRLPCQSLLQSRSRLVSSLHPPSQ